MTRALNEAEADQFALMLLSGAPIGDSVRYFLDANTPDEVIMDAAETWPGQDEVLIALEKYTGGQAWHKMSDQQRLEVALKKHYNEMAYFLWSSNYAEIDGKERLKADTCRSALEVKVAGMAGQDSPLSRFYSDMLDKYEPKGQAS
jgi:hypothetical protein|tara:strand:+ start:460 stop:897 length:438 start_codon:yes stop_codon:yes gene_type:complete